MKRVTLFAAAILLCVQGFAGPVTQDEAQRRAAQFISSRHQVTAATAKRLAKGQQTPGMQAAKVSSASYHVFNIDADGGFVIVSGDDRTPSILGYADSGHFDEATLPDNMRQWLRACEQQMEWLNLPAATATQTAPQRRAPSVRHSVAPLLTTTWDQTDPYNRLVLDATKYKDVCFTGCVATAMAQVLNYHGQLTGRPEKTTDDINPYVTNTVGYSVAGVSKGTAIDWADMLGSYTFGMATDTDEEKRQVEAVAQLMHICGASVGMDYGTGSSGSDPTLMPMALKKYFGYDQATRNVVREHYSIVQWNDMVYAELAAQRPVLMSGQSSGGGHAFVVDGFDGDELFHINWGWGGHCNGYYLLALANPTDKQGVGAGNSADGYSMVQYAVIGAQPDTGQPYDAGGLMMDIMNIKADQGTVTFSAYNQNEKTATFQVGIGYFQDDGTIMPIKYFETNSLPQHWGYPSLSFEVKLPKSDGTVYKVAVICREMGTDKWLTPMNTDTYYIEATSGKSGVTLSIVKPQAVLKVEGISFDTEPRARREHLANVTVSNSGDEYYGKLNFTYTSADGTDTGTCPVGVTITTGQTQTVQFPFKPEQAGKYEIKIGTDSEDIYTTTVDVGTAAPTSKNVDLGIDIKIANLDMTGKAILGNKAQVVVTVTNDTDVDFEGMFVVLLVEPGPYSYRWVARHFDAHSETVLEQEFDVAQGKSYVPLCMTEIPGRTQVTQSPMVSYGVAPAVTIYMADGTHHAIEAEATVAIPDSAVAVDLTGNSTTKAVTASTNPNCIYYLSEDAATPEGLSANVVKGSQAESLMLADSGLPFAPIASFTAKTAAYTRSFGKGLVVEGGDVVPTWTTICLPFDVEACTLSDGTKVEWMRPNADDGHDFWLMDFIGDERNTLYFAPAEEMLAHKPYMLMVPGKGLKGLPDMTAAPVTFRATDAEIKAGAKGIAASTNFKFVGTMEEVTDNDKAYEIAADGSICARAVVKAQPFRAYMKAMSHAATPNNVPISIAATISAEAGDDAESVKGDVNGDGTVDVADISAVITVMADMATEERQKAADVNGDGTVDVADISAVITIMANQ